MSRALSLSILLALVLGCAEPPRSEATVPAVCAPQASLSCVDDHLYDVDSCGKVDAAPASTCICPCAQGGTGCPRWIEPALLTPWASCNVATSCLHVEDVHCGELSGEWVHGYRMVNVCDFPIRCYAYQRTDTTMRMLDGGLLEEVWRQYSGPPWVPELDPGQQEFGLRFSFATEEACRTVWDAPTVTELSYHVCVRADDPVATCLPDLSDPLVDLSPVCP
ncbi:MULTISPECIES: hypothetical protein [unclassified Anaeromyxobacter]|uniref:hypothetical protein n=1 Tax=unclassified Anaeromyxobacter TaxID=2620896 RepID=UPI001F57D739|nr:MULTISPECIES: hypothetical protein [unclassified Anaeromyxobacter]